MDKIKGLYNGEKCTILLRQEGAGHCSDCKFNGKCDHQSDESLVVNGLDILKGYCYECIKSNIIEEVIIGEDPESDDISKEEIHEKFCKDQCFRYKSDKNTEFCINMGDKIKCPLEFIFNKIK